MNLEQPNVDALRALVRDANWNDEFTLEPVRVEASVRRYYRLGNARADAKDLILSVNPPFARDKDDFLVLARFLNENGVPVPNVVAVDEARGWVVQSDAGRDDLAALLGKHPVRDEGEANVQRRREILKATLDLLVGLHALPMPALVAERHFDYDKLWFELDFLLQQIRALCARFDAPSPLAFELEMFLQEVCGALEHEANETGEVFTHRDFHTRNIFIADPDDATGSLTLIDFQDARAGLPWYDLASLLWDPYTSFTPDEREFAFQYYVDTTGRRTKRMRDMYYAQALQRMFKALGTYLFQTYEKDLPVFYPSIHAALIRIEEIAQRGFFPDSVYLFVRHFQEGLLPRLPKPPEGPA